MQRRHFIQTAAALAAAGISMPHLMAAEQAGALSKLGKPQPFSYAWLKGQASMLAGQAWRQPATRVPDELTQLDWDQYQSIGYHDQHALWAEQKRRFEVKFFHLGRGFTAPVHMHEVIDGQAQELAYDPSMFDYGKSGVRGSRLPKDLGFAGFRVNFHTDWQRDVAAFLGASYFRAVGGEAQYGLSARGLAIDCGAERPEEFPVFTSYWLERPSPTSSVLTVYGLLDSPSVAGAYRFDIHPGEMMVMDVDAALYPRKPIERLGIAPLTSMFQHGENDHRMANDWRAEIHDSDGLAMWRGNGEWIWRPLTNPAGLRFSAYADENPRGFGLLQRDRQFDHYQDDGVFYERRPSLWVEPKAGWGKGAVQLVELPTDDETNDNIVAFWNPEAKLQAGQERLFSYRLHWGAKPPVQPTAAQVVATRAGIGGVVGQKRKYFSWRFVVDFAGGSLPMLREGAKVEPVITVSRGQVEITSARPLASVNGYRAMFDLRPLDDSTAPVELRLYLSYNGQPMSETWLYQWTPPPAAQRRA